MISACRTSDSSCVTRSVSRSKAAAPLCSAPKSNAAATTPGGVVAAQQRHRDADEAVFRREPHPELAGVAQDFPHTHQPRQPAGQATWR